MYLPVTVPHRLISQRSIIVTVAAMLFAGIVSLPVIAAAATASTSVSSTIASVVSLSSSGTVNVNVTPTGAGAQTIASDTVTVSTNDTAGYTLTLGESSATTTLTSGGNTIPASSGTQASPTAMSANTWGYRVDGLGGFGAGPTSGQSSASIGSIKFAAVAASGSPNTLKTTSSTATNEDTTVWYGVAANTSQPSGTYTNSVTYTVTAN